MRNVPISESTKMHEEHRRSSPSLATATSAWTIHRGIWDGVTPNMALTSFKAFILSKVAPLSLSRDLG